MSSGMDYKVPDVVAENERLRLREQCMVPVVLWAFEHLYHQDCANAAMHCAPVRFSPLTFRLAEVLAVSWGEDEDWTAELAHVMGDRGEYEEDPGR